MNARCLVAILRCAGEKIDCLFVTVHDLGSSFLDSRFKLLIEVGKPIPVFLEAEVIAHPYAELRGIHWLYEIVFSSTFKGFLGETPDLRDR